MKTPVIWMPVYVADVDTVAKGLTAEQEGIFHRLMRILFGLKGSCQTRTAFHYSYNSARRSGEQSGTSFLLPSKPTASASI
jgi:hypothetical protein